MFITAPRIHLLCIYGILGLLGMFTCSCSSPTPPQRPIPRSGLVLSLVADQYSQSYMTTHRNLFRYGLKQLLDEGVVYTEARHDHALTSTCPGHATLFTGHHPKDHGIIENYWFERATDQVIYCVNDKKHGVSPFRLKKKTLGDLLKDSSPRSKVFAVSGKDRAAVLSAGHSADGAFWYDSKKGHFITSSAYTTSPELKRSVAKATQAKQFFGRLWEQSAQSFYPPEVSDTQKTYFHLQFPYTFGGPSLFPDKVFFEQVYRSPFLDVLTRDAAIHLLKSQQLGRSGTLDVLIVSFSSLDIIGHIFGPHSKEVAEILAQLDLLIGTILDEAMQQVGKDNLFVTFSSDHGIAPIPEERAARKLNGARQSWQEVSCMQKAGENIATVLGSEDLFLSHYYINKKEQKKKGISNLQLDSLVKGSIERCPHVKKVWSREELIAQSSSDNTARLFLNSLDQSRSPDYVVQFESHYIDIPYQGTNHGTPYDYDRHVPLIFLLPQISHKEISTPTRTIDLVPSLLSILRLEATYDGEGLNLYARDRYPLDTMRRDHQHSNKGTVLNKKPTNALFLSKD
jgi:Type I phosphodiesterase / nucleotide pyrophosphatase